MAVLPHLLNHPPVATLMFRLTGTLLATILFPAASILAQTIVVDSPTADAGTVQRGTQVTKDFVVKNTGSLPLKIAEVKPGCGCMKAKFDKSVAPGGVGKISLTVDTTSFKTAISKSATVVSNDPVTPQLSLIVVANVKGAIRGEPSDSVRIKTTKGQIGAAEVFLVSDHPSFKPTGATASEPYLSALLLPDSQPGRWKVMVTAGTNAPVGPLYGSVTVKTSIPEEPEFRLPVTGVIMASGQTAGASAAAGAMTNEEVVKLLAAELGDEIVIAKIKNAPVARFDMSTDALLSLKEQKVSKAVITAMIERAGQGDRSSMSSPSASAPPKTTGPCEGVELLGLHKEDFRPVSPLILYFAKVRNGTSMTKIVSVEWTNLYGERIRNTAEVGAGQIARLQLAAQQPVERLPIDLRLGTCR